MAATSDSHSARKRSAVCINWSRDDLLKTLSCALCDRVFDDDGRAPRSLHCGHHFCTACIGARTHQNSARKWSVSCPIDHEETPLTKNDASTIGKCFAVAIEVERVRAAGRVPFRVNVHNLAGDVRPVVALSSDKVGDLKLCIRESRSECAERLQRLLLHGADGNLTLLEDDAATLGALGLDSGDRVVTVVVRDGYRGGDYVRTNFRDVGQFTSPVGMCVSNNYELFVADTGRRRGMFAGIRVLRASDGMHLRAYEWPSGGDDDDDDDDVSGSPSFVCLSPNGEFVIAVEQTPGRHVRVLRAADCTLVRSFPINQGGEFPIAPAGICMSPDGELLYVSDDLHYNAVFVVRLADGSIERMLGSRGRGDGQFSSPCGVCLTPNGELMYVADRNNHRVQVIQTSDGAHVRTLGGDGARNGSGQFSYPQEVMVSGEWLLVAEYGNHRVQVVSAANGAHEMNIAMPPRPDPTRCDFLNRACLSPAGNGQLLVSDSSGCIVVYTA